MASPLMLMMTGASVTNKASEVASSPPAAASDIPSPIPSASLPPDATKFLYMSLHRVDNLVRQYQHLRSISNIQANTLAHSSMRLSALAHSSLAHSTRTIDFDHVLFPPHPRLSLADRMSISLKMKIEEVCEEITVSLQDMEMAGMAIHDVLVSLCDLMTHLDGGNSQMGEVEKGVKHVRQVYFDTMAEVRARRDLWAKFISDERNMAFMTASTLGEVMVSPDIDWDAFAKGWIALDQEDRESVGGEVDDLADAFSNWGKGAAKDQSEDGAMME